MDPAPVVCSLVYPLRERNGSKQVLMSLGTRGVHDGLRNGYGGRLETCDESILHCALRELEEEVGLTVEITHLTAAGVIEFRHPNDVPGLRVSGADRTVVHVFTVTQFTGTPRDSDAMVDPRWYPVDQLPYDGMKADAPRWVPNLLRGEFIRAVVTYDADQRVRTFKREGT